MFSTNVKLIEQHWQQKVALKGKSLIDEDRFGTRAGPSASSRGQQRRSGSKRAHRRRKVAADPGGRSDQLRFSGLFFFLLHSTVRALVRDPSSGISWLNRLYGHAHTCVCLENRTERVLIGSEPGELALNKARHFTLCWWRHYPELREEPDWSRCPRCSRCSSCSRRSRRGLCLKGAV